MNEQLQQAVLGDWGARQRRAILESWIEKTEAEQGYESNLTAWLKGIVEALGAMVTCSHGDDPALCNECRDIYDEP